MLYLLYPDINLCFNAIFLSRFFADIKNYTTFATLLKGSTSAKEFWRGGRVVDCGGLENRCAARHPGFESLSLRNKR